MTATDMPALAYGAHRFATERHADQAYGSRLHTHHLAAVDRILVETGCADGPMGPHWRAAAWLHDVVEDTETPIDVVRGKFGFFVAGLVWAVTGVGENRKARNADIYAKLKAFPMACILKAADRVANIEDAIEISSTKYLGMYVKESETFMDALAPYADEIPNALMQRLHRANLRATARLNSLNHSH